VFRVARCLLRPDLYEDLGCARIGRRGHGGDPLTARASIPGRRESQGRCDAVEQQVERGKAIVVLTDGGDNDAEARREIAAARELGIAVFLVGHGTPAGGVVYDIDSFTGKRIDTPSGSPMARP